MPKIIAIACHKGGVGKTTTVSSLGGLLSLRGGCRTLLVDLDPQRNLTTTFTDGEFDRTIFDVFFEYVNPVQKPDKRAGRHRAIPELPIYEIGEGLDLVPSSVKMFSIDVVTAGEYDRGNILKKALSSVKNNYDYIIIDCPAQLGTGTGNALIAADYVLIPMSCDAYSAEGLNQIDDFVTEIDSLNPQLDILGIVVTRFRKNRRVDSSILEALKEAWGEKVFNTIIMQSEELLQAPLMKKDIAHYKIKSRGAQDYNSLLSEIEERTSE